MRFGVFVNGIVKQLALEIDLHDIRQMGLIHFLWCGRAWAAVPLTLPPNVLGGVLTIGLAPFFSVVQRQCGLERYLGRLSTTNGVPSGRAQQTTEQGTLPPTLHPSGPGWLLCPGLGLPSSSLRYDSISGSWL